MTIHELPGGHMQLDCDTEPCSATISGRYSEDELLDVAEEQGWNIDREHWPY